MLEIDSKLFGLKTLVFNHYVKIKPHLFNYFTLHYIISVLVGADAIETSWWFLFHLINITTEIIFRHKRFPQNCDESSSATDYVTFS